MKEICIDASVVVKVAIPTDLSVEAKSLFVESGKKGIRLIAPPLIEPEVDSIIRWLVKQKQISKKASQLAFNTVDVLPIKVYIHPQMRQRAREIAELCDQGRVYDSTYAALAELRGCDFWTADKRFFNAVKSKFSFVRYLGNFKGLSKKNSIE